MPNSGSETRQRTVSLSVRLTPVEADLVRSQASRAGTSVAALIRYALLKQTPPRASRQTTANTKELAQLVGMIGLLKSSLKEAAERSNSRQCDAMVDAAFRDIADMRNALFEALGREP